MSSVFLLTAGQTPCDLEIESLQHPERYPLVIKRNALNFVGVQYPSVNDTQVREAEAEDVGTALPALLNREMFLA